jgi:acyl-CoA reductase-like NAD-dependent aldehyde dehydrogenase
MRIRMIAATGSVATARKVVAAAAASNLKKVILELGGKSPVIVFDDTKDLATAAAHCAVSIGWNCTLYMFKLSVNAF